jgi:hypothetical protein
MNIFEVQKMREKKQPASSHEVEEEEENKNIHTSVSRVSLILWTDKLMNNPENAF